MKLGNETKLVKGIILSTVADAPARSTMLDFMQFTGSFGRPTCYASGESCSTTHRQCHVYPYDTTEENTFSGHLKQRSHDETIKLGRDPCKNPGSIS